MVSEWQESKISQMKRARRDMVLRLGAMSLSTSALGKGPSGSFFGLGPASIGRNTSSRLNGLGGSFGAARCWLPCPMRTIRTVSSPRLLARRFSRIVAAAFGQAILEFEEGALDIDP